MENESPPPSHLEYAIPGHDERVLYSREADRATLVIHRPERRAKAAVDATTDVAVQGLILWIIAGVVIAKWWSPLLLIPSVPAFFLGFYGLAWLCSYRLSRPIIVEFDAGKLRAWNLDTRPHRRNLDLEGVYEIKYVQHSKNIFVRRRGQEIFELFLTPNPEDGQRIAEFLGNVAGLRVPSQGIESSPT